MPAPTVQSGWEKVQAISSSCREKARARVGVGSHVWPGFRRVTASCTPTDTLIFDRGFFVPCGLEDLLKRELSFEDSG